METNKCVYEWRKPGKGWRPDLVPENKIQCDGMGMSLF